MRLIGIAIVSACLACGPALAQQATCTAQASDKKLAGAAKTSFMKKCDTDATTTCTAQATEKKLSGAARNSFVKKCHTDMVGA